MQVVVICSATQRLELAEAAGSVIFLDDIAAMAGVQANVVFDLLFEGNEAEHLPQLRQLSAPAIVVGHVAGFDGLPPAWCRINAWPGFLQGAVAEVCGGSAPCRELVLQGLSLLGKNPEWAPDVPGMISARVVAAIINEAWFTLAEGIATRTDIDTAMKLGTAYPFGPFAWGEHIGLHKVAGLLGRMAATDDRYQPCPLLLEASV